MILKFLKTEHKNIKQMKKKNSHTKKKREKTKKREKEIRNIWRNEEQVKNKQGKRKKWKEEVIGCQICSFEKFAEAQEVHREETCETLGFMLSRDWQEKKSKCAYWNGGLICFKYEVNP